MLTQLRNILLRCRLHFTFARILYKHCTSAVWHRYNSILRTKMNARYSILLFCSLFFTAVVSLPRNKRLVEISREKRKVCSNCHLKIDGKYYYYKYDKENVEEYGGLHSNLAWYCLQGEAIKVNNGGIRGIPWIIAAEEYDEYRPLTILNNKLVLSQDYIPTLDELKRSATNNTCDIALSIIQNSYSGQIVLQSCSGDWKLHNNSMSDSYNVVLEYWC